MSLTIVLFSSAMVKRRSSCATKATHYASILSLNGFSSDNPPNREQGTDRPGRSTASLGVGRSAMEEVDWHHLAKERFTSEVAEALYRHGHANRFEELVIIAPPKILGNLRKVLHAEVVDLIAAEIPKDLTTHPLSEIEKLIAT